eukprot:53768-Rhodomonas_salina.2
MVGGVLVAGQALDHGEHGRRRQVKHATDHDPARPPAPDPAQAGGGCVLSSFDRRCSSEHFGVGRSVCRPGGSCRRSGRLERGGGGGEAADEEVVEGTWKAEFSAWNRTLQSMERYSTQSVKQRHTQSVKQCHTQSVKQCHTQSMKQCRTQSVKQCRTQSTELYRTQTMEPYRTQSTKQLAVYGTVPHAVHETVPRKLWRRLVKEGSKAAGEGEEGEGGAIEMGEEGEEGEGEGEEEEGWRERVAA